jgi:hypothetical protein
MEPLSPLLHRPAFRKWNLKPLFSQRATTKQGGSREETVPNPSQCQGYTDASEGQEERQGRWHRALTKALGLPIEFFHLNWAPRHLAEREKSRADYINGFLRIALEIHTVSIDSLVAF